MSEREWAISAGAGSDQPQGSAGVEIVPRVSGPNAAKKVLKTKLEGPLISSTSLRLTRPLLAAVLDVDRPVVIDLRGVPQIDSDGLALLLKVHKTMPAEFRPLSLRVAPGSQTERVLNLCGFGMIMTLLSDRT